MAIAMKCPACGTAFDFPDDLRGKRIKCKSCGEIFKIEAAAPKPAPASKSAPAVKPAPGSKSLPAVKPAPGSKAVPAVKPAPAAAKPKSKPVIDDDDEDDRPRAKRRDDDDEDDRPRPKRRAADDDEDDRPRSKRRDDDEGDEKSARRGQWDEEDDRPAKKRGLHPMLIIGPALGVILVGGVTAVLLLRGGKKDKDSADSANKGPLVSCPVDLAEKEINQLIVSDSGNVFATFRRAEAFGTTWEAEPLDITTGKSHGKNRIPELESPQYVTMSPDGRYVMVEQEAQFGRNDRALTIFDTVDKTDLTRGKWVPYPRQDIFRDPTLYKAEFIGNDKVVTINTARGLDVWQLPGFVQVVKGARVRSVGEPLVGWMERNDSLKAERFVAFTADRKQVAVWTGDGYAVLNAEDGAEVVRFSTKAMNFVNAKAGPVAWRPDGKALAMVFEYGNFGAQSTVLVLWNPTAEDAPAVHRLYASQFDYSKGISWWGNRYIATTGSRVEGILIDSQTGKAVRQLMPPPKKVFSFSRGGKLWYAATPERKDNKPNVNDPATVVLADPPDDLIEKDGNPDPYEDVPAARGRFLRRLWMEPTGVLRAPTRFDPPVAARLVGQP